MKKAKRGHHEKGLDDAYCLRGLGIWLDWATLTIHKDDRPTTQESDHKDSGYHYCTYDRSVTHNTTDYKSLEGERGRTLYPTP